MAHQAGRQVGHRPFLWAALVGVFVDEGAAVQAPPRRSRKSSPRDFAEPPRPAGVVVKPQRCQSRSRRCLASRQSRGPCASCTSRPAHYTIFRPSCDILDGRKEAAAWNFPAEWLARMRRLLGGEYEAFLAAMGAEPALALRLNALRAGAETSRGGGGRALVALRGAPEARRRRADGL